jgi:hypothetical protein
MAAARAGVPIGDRVFAAPPGLGQHPAAVNAI